MPDPRVAHCVFCDDIRHEVGNKLSLMGLYVGEMVVFGTAPTMLPKFGIVVWVISDIDDPVERVTTTILMPPDRTQVLKLESSSPAPAIPHLSEGARKLIAHQVIPLAPFPIQQPGFIEVMLETELGPLRAGRLMVRFADPATAGAQILPSDGLLI